MTRNPDKGLNCLMDQYIGLVYAIVRGRLSGSGTHEDIEECVSDVFLDLYEDIALFDLSKGSIKAYLSVIARRKAIDLYRRLVRQPDKISTDETDTADTAADVEAAFTAMQTKQSLLDSVRSLGEPEREIFIRRYYLGQSTKEIAKATRMKENTVDKRISRGLQKLKAILGGVV
jgi:RNA polymerase sigma-70 factor (ECF subfamily)